MLSVIYHLISILQAPLRTVVTVIAIPIRQTPILSTHHSLKCNTYRPPILILLV